MPYLVAYGDQLFSLNNNYSNESNIWIGMYIKFAINSAVLIFYLFFGDSYSFYYPELIVAAKKQILE